ncbi:hypothetical protein FRB95_011320 [Tulasnella sp. JGI-2019a]|nr:hypothetical protein FRB93_004643 [Tulasnella sp. JGI-2019a]KAG9035455.1 hypothetical protein FRB95_011320 [Tulasnella sp. JGI-2019a]
MTLRHELLTYLDHPLARIARLLTLGSQENRVWTERYLNHSNWESLHAVLSQKIQNIVVVSGLLLSASVNLLCTGPLHRMTHNTVVASMCASLMSIIFGLLCLWSLVGQKPSELKYLTRRGLLFQYLYSSPSLWGGGSALAFFVAIGAWVWLDLQSSLTTRILVILLSAALIANAGVCFVIGGTKWRE